MEVINGVENYVLWEISALIPTVTELDVYASITVGIDYRLCKCGQCIFQTKPKQNHARGQITETVVYLLMVPSFGIACHMTCCQQTYIAVAEYLHEETESIYVWYW